MAAGIALVAHWEEVTAMWPYVLHSAAIVGLVVSAYGFFYDSCKAGLAGYLGSDTAAGILSALIVGVGSLAVVLLLGWLWSWRKIGTVRRIRARCLQEVDASAEPIQTLEQEFLRPGRINAKGRQELVELWQRLLEECPLARDDDDLEWRFRIYPELRAARELRRAVTEGMRRVKYLLTDGGTGPVSAIHRSHEMTIDVHSRHLSRFREILNELGVPGLMN